MILKYATITENLKTHSLILFVAKDFCTVQKKVAELIKGRVLVGHALHNDLKVCIILLLVGLNVVSF